jgi:5-methylcytosine-specific restriction endonuclease McrA
MPSIPGKLRRFVRARARFHCEYCKAPLRILVSMEVDHVKPRGLEGETNADNLCLACTSCNGSKHDFITAIDPQTEVEVPLYNPRTQQWTEHFRWNNDVTVILGLTAIGRATIVRLRMNRRDLVIARRLWKLAGWSPPD